MGVNLNIKEARALGEDITQKDLSQTFQIRTSSGQPVNFQTPVGYYKKYSKKGILFIEVPKAKINTPSEKLLLKFARGMKGGSRKRK